MYWRVIFNSLRVFSPSQHFNCTFKNVFSENHPWMVQNIIQPVDSIILEPLLHLHNCRVSPFFKCYAIWDPMPVEHAVHNPKCCSWSRQTGKANSYLDYSFLWQWSISVSNGKGLMLSTNWAPSSQLVSTNNAKPRTRWWSLLLTSWINLGKWESILLDNIWSLSLLPYPFY